MSRTCGQMIVHELLCETVPDYRANRLAAEAATREAIDSGRALEAARELVTLPVVVHVVYRTDAENVSDEQVGSQVDALNRDFRAANEDRSQVPPVWTSLVGDANVAFTLDDVTRTETTVESFGPDDTVKSPKTGGIAPVAGKLNLWCCTLGQSLLGYAQFPGGPAKTDGVVILNTAFGTSGSVAAPFNKGRTATHEIGHFLNLRHIWGDRNDCSGNDFVVDTPPAQAANTGKPKFPHITCNNGPNGDMFMNYMDYTDDDAMFMFTVGQIARMNATLAGPREALAARA
jgi:hypothetical protein